MPVNIKPILQTSNSDQREFIPHKPSMSNYRAKWLIYGETSAGKTTLVGRANGHPQMYPSLLIDCDGGELALTDEKFLGCEPPDVLAFEGFDWLDDLLWQIRTGKLKYKTLIFDTFSELQKKSMDEWMLVKAKLTKDAGKELKNRHIDDVHLDDYGSNTQHMRRVTRELCDLPCHIILTAHSRDTDHEGKPIQLGPSFTPALLGTIKTLMDVTGYLHQGALKPEKEGGDPVPVHVLRTREIPGRTGIYAKDRSPDRKLPALMLRPTGANIFETIIQPKGEGSK